MDSRIIALVLAGGQDDELAISQSVLHKADIIVNGKPLFEPVLLALHKSKSISKIIYVGDLDSKYLHLVDAVVPAGASFVESLAAGFVAANHNNTSIIMVITADLPFISKETIDDFCNNSIDADLIYPIIKKEASLKQFPKQKRTYAKFIEGNFTGGNAILLKPKIIPELLIFADKAYKARKSPLRLALLIGIISFIKLLIGRSSIKVLEKKVTRLLDAQVKTYICSDASLGADVDKLEHLQSITEN